MTICLLPVFHKFWARICYCKNKLWLALQSSPCLRILEDKNYSDTRPHRTFSIWTMYVLPTAFLHEAIQRYLKGLGGMQRESFYKTPHCFTWPRKSTFHSGHSKPPEWAGILSALCPITWVASAAAAVKSAGFQESTGWQLSPKILSGRCKGVASMPNSKM